ncbi:MAG: hypothetical protein ABJH45_17820 [Paracoccaceae bacterium]
MTQAGSEFVQDAKKILADTDASAKLVLDLEGIGEAGGVDIVELNRMKSDAELSVDWMI